MGRRRKGREIALQILYEIDSGPGLKNNCTMEQRIIEHLNYFNVSGAERDLAYLLSNGVCQNLQSIDHKIDIATENWTLNRLTSIDRNIIRLAVYEMVFLDDVSFKTTINEAIEIAKRFGTEQSGKFVNGVLDRIHRLSSELKERDGTDMELRDPM
ncbi:transcription antitermination factor NusB [bacterium]|nr:transcription antitermination factor NusB [candidate division CSSED10-310 bacterium]